MLSPARVRVVAVAAAAALTLTACGELSVNAQHPVAATLVPSASTPTATPSSSSPAHTAPRPAPSPTTSSPTPRRTTATPTATQVRALVRTQVDKIIKSEPAGSVSVAALNMTTGRSFTAGATSGMWTASCYKLLVLISYLLANGGIGGNYSTAERAIENSDNVAGYALYTAAGGTPALNTALQKLGATHTVPGMSDPTFTRTSASDYVKALKALVTPGVLTRSERSLILGLMENVESDQRWGVGAVADKGTDFANKNGWLSIDDDNGPEESDGGLWAVNSGGIVRIGGQQVLMAVFTQHQSDFETGKQLVIKLAKTIAPAVATS